MSDRTHAPSAPTHYPSQADAALSRVSDRTVPRLSDADRAAHEAASFLSPKGLASLDRLTTVLGVNV